jgi:hypothetical protein
MRQPSPGSLGELALPLHKSTFAKKHFQIRFGVAVFARHKLGIVKIL